MSDVLKNQLDRWVARSEPVGASAMLDRVEHQIEQGAVSDAPVAERRRYPGLVITAAAAVAVLALVGLIPLLFPPVDSVDPADSTVPVTATTIAPTPSTTLEASPVTTIALDVPSTPLPPTVGVQASSDWVAVDGAANAAFDISGQLGDVVAFNGEWVVIGQNCDATDPLCTRSVWVSPDLVTWERHDLDGRGSWASLVEFDGMLVAGGRHYDDEARCSAAIWVSGDARIWELVSTDTAVFARSDPAPDPQVSPCGLYVSDLAESRGRLVGVGHAMGTATAVWASGDGRLWERIADDDQAWPPGGYASTDRVHAVGENLVALGSCWVMDECLSFPSTFWVSTDGGESWAEGNSLGLSPDANPVAFGVGLTGDADTPEGMAFNGRACDWVQDGEDVSATSCGPAVWETSDGISWSHASLERDAVTQRDVLELTDGGFVALGFEWAEPPNDGPASWWTWLSSEGSTWTVEPAPLAGENSLNNSVSLGSAVIVVGSRGPLDSPGMVPVVWVRSI